MWCRVAELWAEEVGSYFREDGQGGTLSCNQTHEKHPSRYQVKRSSRRQALCIFKAEKGGYYSTAGSESQGRQGPELKALVDQWERIHLQCRKHGFSPWVRKIPWRRKRLPTPVFLLGKCMDRGAWPATVYGSHKKSDTTEQLSTCSAQSCLTLCDPQGLWLTRLLCPWDFPGKNTGVGCHFLLQSTVQHLPLTH